MESYMDDTWISDDLTYKTEAKSIYALYVIMLFMCLCSCCCGAGTYHYASRANREAVRRNHQELPQSDFDDPMMKKEPTPTSYAPQNNM